MEIEKIVNLNLMLIIIKNENFNLKVLNHHLIIDKNLIIIKF
jgi:hypothetical protein